MTMYVCIKCEKWVRYNGLLYRRCKGKRHALVSMATHIDRQLGQYLPSKSEGARGARCDCGAYLPLGSGITCETCKRRMWGQR